jgi:hypothetical protein
MTGRREWFGYGDYVSLSPDGKTELQFPYVTEPPHGDSLHKIYLASTELAGLAWGSGIAWSPCSRYFTIDWTEGPGPSSRQIAVFDCWCVLRSIVNIPKTNYERVSRFAFPELYAERNQEELLVYTFNNSEGWRAAA